MLILGLIVGWRLPWDRYFALEGITVEGGERINTAQVERLTGVHPPVSLWAIHTQQFRQKLLSVPWIKEAQVTKVYPHWLHISLQEREPYGIIALGSGKYRWVDQEGYLLESLNYPPPEPFISGVSIVETPRGARIAETGAREILRDFYRLDGRRLAGWRELRWRGNSILLISRRGWQALLPSRELSAHLSLLSRVLVALKADRAKPRRIDLRFSGEVTLGK